MELGTISAIAIAAAINAAMPGPVIALTVGRSARDGMKAGLNVTIGVLLANIILATSALLVMLGLFAMSDTVFTVMKWLGACALLALGIKMILPSAGTGEDSLVSREARLKDCCAGLVVGMSSPYNLVFLLALLPQFVPAALLHGTGVALVVATVLVGVSVAQGGATLVGAFSGRAMSQLARPIERIGALLMIGFAVVAVAAPVA